MHGLEVADRDLNGSRCRNKERRNRLQAQKTRGKADVQATIFIWMPTIETRRDSESKHRGHGLAKANRRDAESEAPVLYGVTRDLATRMNMPMPKVYISPSDAPNGFATGRNPNHAAVAATEGILRLLTRDELMGVMAHELGT